MLERREGGRKAWQKDRREGAVREEAGTRCEWFAKAAPMVTGDALSLQGFSGNKALDHHRSKFHG